MFFCSKEKFSVNQPYLSKQFLPDISQIQKNLKPLTNSMKTFITAQLRHENVMDNYQISFRKETPENETKILLSY